MFTRPASYFISFIYKQIFFFLNSENQNCNASTVSQLASVRKVKNKSSPGGKYRRKLHTKERAKELLFKAKREGRILDCQDHEGKKPCLRASSIQ